MQKPDYVFTITVSPVARVIGCAAKREQESRGMFGFHQFTNCLKCQVIDEGFELWGENGFRQGGAKNYKHLAHCLKARAIKQWRATTNKEYPKGSLIGYRFKVGGAMYYKG